MEVGEGKQTANCMDLEFLYHVCTQADMNKITAYKRRYAWRLQNFSSAVVKLLFIINIDNKIFFQ